ncbi:hypothetical protein D3C75_1367460 [compost metagenome]
MQTCFSFVRHIVVDIGHGAVGFSNNQNMRNKSRFGIVGKQNRLERSLNYNVLRHIEEYPAVPKGRMQRS